MIKFSYLELDNIIVEEGLRKTPLEKKRLDELADSIGKHGILQPIMVEPTEEEGRYRLLLGERRTRAAMMAGLKTVPAQILEQPLHPNEALEVRLVENLHREGLDPLDEAEAYAAMKEMGHTISAMGRGVGKSRPYVSHRMRLLRLHPKVREAVRRRTLTPGHGNALLRLEPEQQLTLAKQIQVDGLTVKETRQRVREILGKELKWHLVPVRFSLEVYEKLESMASGGDVNKLIQQTMHDLIKV
jgi:ParB family chromosome partitioning protein